MGRGLEGSSQAGSGGREGVPPEGSEAGLRSLWYPSLGGGAGVAHVCEAVAKAPRRLVQWPRGKAVPRGRWSGLA